MITFTLKKDNKTGLYSVYENGIKAKNPIFTGIKDFEHELKTLGLNKLYQIKIQEVKA